MTKTEAVVVVVVVAASLVWSVHAGGRREGEERDAVVVTARVVLFGFFDVDWAGRSLSRLPTKQR